MKAIRSWRGAGVAGFCLMSLMFQPFITSNGSWAQEKAPGGAAAPQAAATEFKVPPGTKDAVTAILTRRSIREYTPHPVPDEMVRLLLEAAMAAPSAVDERSTEFIVIKDRKVLDEIHKFNTRRPQLKMASVAIVVCGNQAKERYPGRGFWQLDGAVAAENILIAANGVGLGAVWTAIYPYQDRVAKVQKLLGLPENVIPLNIIPVGYPAERKFRESLYDASRVHFERW